MNKLTMIAVVLGLMWGVTASACETYVSQERYDKKERNHNRELRQATRLVEQKELDIVNEAGLRESLIYKYHTQTTQGHYKPGYKPKQTIYAEYEENVTIMSKELKKLEREKFKLERDWKKVCVEVTEPVVEEKIEFRGEEYTEDELRAVLVKLLLELLKELYE